MALHAASKTLALTHSFQRVPPEEVLKANSRYEAPCSDQTNEIPNKPQIPRARPQPVFSGAENQGNSAPREAPLCLSGPRIPSLSPHPAMAGLAQQPPQDTGPAPNTLPTGATSWQLSLPSSAPPGPTVSRQGLLPPTAPHYQHPSVCGVRKGLGDRAGE